MYPFIIKLIGVLKTKKEVLDELERLFAAINITLHLEKTKNIKVIGDIIKDKGLVYTDNVQKLNFCSC